MVAATRSFLESPKCLTLPSLIRSLTALDKSAVRGLGAAGRDSGAIAVVGAARPWQFSFLVAEIVISGCNASQVLCEK